MTEYPIMNC